MNDNKSKICTFATDALRVRQTFILNVLWTPRVCNLVLANHEKEAALSLWQKKVKDRRMV